jgi:hypothetical protein
LILKNIPERLNNGKVKEKATAKTLASSTFEQSLFSTPQPLNFSTFKTAVMTGLEPATIG